jgi:transposase-like protein
VSATAQHQSQAGLFATSRRGGLTSEEIRKAEGMRAKGWGWQNIANVLGRCREDVQQSLEPIDLEIIAAPTSPEVLAARAKIEEQNRDARFAEMWSTNATVADIADHFRVSTVTISKWRLRLGLAARAIKPPPKSSPASSKTCGREAMETAESIAASYGLKFSDIANPASRSRVFSYPRQHVMSALVDQGYSTSSIGQMLHTDHSTVIFGDRRHKARNERAAA